MPVYRYWLTEPAKLDGNIRVPLSSDPSIGGHAMIMVGYQDDTAVPGGGYFIVRNSWGEGWASDSDLAPGYARLPYKYIADNGRSAFVATGAAQAKAAETAARAATDTAANAPADTAT